MNAQKGEQRYGSTLSLASTLDWVEWLRSPLSRFLFGKELQYQLYRRLRGPLGRSVRERKTSPSYGIDPQIVQLVGNHYNDYGIP